MIFSSFVNPHYPLITPYPSFPALRTHTYTAAPNPVAAPRRGLSAAAKALAAPGLDMDVLEALYRHHIGRTQLGEGVCGKSVCVIVELARSVFCSILVVGCGCNRVR